MKTPPQSPGYLIAHNTPIKARDLNSNGSDGGSLYTRRERIVKDLGPIPEYKLESMLNFVFPRLPVEFRIPLKNDLIAARILNNKGPGRWTLFPENPSESKDNENTYFDSLPELARQITDLKLFHNSNNVLAKKNTISSLVAEPNKAPLSARNRVKSRPDFYFVLNKKRSVNLSEGKTAWEDLICVGECKKRNTPADLLDNMTKVIWSCTNIMRTDFTRRFTFGITIEDTDLRLWVFSRSQVMVSKPMLWLTDYSQFIKLIVTLSFAGTTELGYNPLMKPILYNNEAVTEITLNGNVYVSTGKILSEFRARRVLGRGTRVITIRPKDNPNAPELTLKFYWTPTQHCLEGEQLKSLRKQCLENNLVADDFLLTTKDYGVMQFYQDGKLVTDSTELLVRSELKPSSFYRPSDPSAGDAVDEVNRLFEGIGQVPGDRTGDPRVDEATKNQLETRFSLVDGLRHRHQVFLIFKEVGIALHDIVSVSTFLMALREGIKSLQCLHKLNFVHRDVSTGNFIMHDGKVKLMDLEYIKDMKPKLPTGFTDEMKTGTAQFMAREVQFGRFLHRPKGNDVGRHVPLLERAESGMQADNEVGFVPFRYNKLHDVESCYWILLWFFFHHVPKAPEGFNSAAQRRYAWAIFPQERSQLSTERCQAVEDSVYIDNLFASLHPEFKCASEKMQTLAKGLIYAFTDLERNVAGADEVSSTGEIYGFFVEILNQLANSAPLEPLKVDFVMVKEKKMAFANEDSHRPA